MHWRRNSVSRIVRMRRYARPLGGGVVSGFMVLPVPTLPPEPNDDAAFLAAVEAGRASLDAGRSVPHEDVRRWLLSWGADNELPPPVCS